ncbi:hypothetical protein DICTH_1341 [Dictyoglomus thermophilum H-6-12]|uniref:Uncharacterized protein n=1 Tax=Dictyoglomus thermophilum (strain ATCC 35947 / DSM 3960 / H-6-12) TaxID=309799 RepID=B5YF52_DICT6|nr:hypothetical protein DICTH_1341 [Dictyoglomus thermophilum H-6-12]
MSSAAITGHILRTSIARIVMSFKLPIGVATTYNLPIGKLYKFFSTWQIFLYKVK